MLTGAGNQQLNKKEVLSRASQPVPSALFVQSLMGLLARLNVVCSFSSSLTGVWKGGFGAHNQELSSQHRIL